MRKEPAALVCSRSAVGALGRVFVFFFFLTRPLRAPQPPMLPAWHRWAEMLLKQEHVQERGQAAVLGEEGAAAGSSLGTQSLRTELTSVAGSKCPRKVKRGLKKKNLHLVTSGDTELVDRLIWRPGSPNSQQPSLLWWWQLQNQTG